MSLSSTTINRPVLATVMNLLIVIFGAIGYTSLGVRDYPSVDNPVISVRCSFPGANADVIETQLTEPLEAAVNGIPGIRAISSTSRDGTSYINIEFNLEVDMETAANDVRDKVSGAQRRLPQDVDPPVVSKSDADAQPIFSVTLSSATRDIIDLSEFAEVNFKERLQTISGISNVSIWGSKRYSVRMRMAFAQEGFTCLFPVENPASFGHVIPREKIYETAEQCQLYYGEAFQAVTQAWLGGPQQHPEA